MKNFLSAAADQIPPRSGGETKDVIEILHYLKIAVEDIRDQLSKKRKENLAVEEVAELVGRTPYTVRRWISEGRIKAVRIAGCGPKGRLLIAHDQVDRLIAGGMGGDVHPASVG